MPILSRIRYVGVFVICSSSLCSLPCLVSKIKRIAISILTPTSVQYSYPSCIVVLAPYLNLCTRPLPSLGLTAECQGAPPLPTSGHVPCLPMRLSCLLCTCGLGLCPLSGLVCDLLLRGGWGLSPECALPEEYLRHNLDEQCSENTRVPYLPWCPNCLASDVWGGTIPLAPRSFSVRGAWLLERVSPVDACQPTNSELFLPAGSARTRP